MTDITKCTNEDCLLKEKCYRWTAKDDQYDQSYGYFAPDKDGECRDFWGIEL
jgi:hypothetical protein